MVERVRLAPTGKFVEVGGADGNGLTTLVFVDPGTALAPESQTGSALAPFSTIAAALALLLAGPGGGALFLCDGDYLGESFEWAPSADDPAKRGLELIGTNGVHGIGTITLTGTDGAVGSLLLRSIGAPRGGFNFQIGVESIQATGNALVDVADSYVGNLNGEAGTTLRGVDSLMQLVNGVGEVTVQNMHFANFPVQCSTLTATNCIFDDVVDAGAAQFTGCTFLAACTAIDMQLFGCTVLAGPLTASGSIQIRQSKCGSDGAVDITAESMVVQDCELTAAIDVDTELQIDRKSYQFTRNHGTVAAATFIFSDLQSEISDVAWDAGAPLVQTVLPLGHAPGLYLISTCVIVRTAAGAGTFTRAAGFTAPTQGAVSATAPGGLLTSTGAVGSITSEAVRSTGAAALTVTLTPVGVTGAPVIDVYSTATLIAAA